MALAKWIAASGDENGLTLAFSILGLRSLTLNFSRMLGDFIAGSLRELNYNEMF